MILVKVVIISEDCSAVYQVYTLQNFTAHTNALPCREHSKRLFGTRDVSSVNFKIYIFLFVLHYAHQNLSLRPDFPSISKPSYNQNHAQNH